MSAMKGETNLEGVPRMARSPSPSLGPRGRRIQNLDSPLPPGTPASGKSSFCAMSPCSSAPEWASNIARGHVRNFLPNDAGKGPIPCSLARL